MGKLENTTTITIILRPFLLFPTQKEQKTKKTINKILKKNNKTKHKKIQNIDP